MTESTNLDRIRGAALDRVDKARRIFWILVLLTGLCEGGLLVTVVLLMDWADPLHRLLLATAALIYLTLGTAIVTLGAYVNWCTQRVLRALAPGE